MVNKTKVKMISELKSEFAKKQGTEKARWVSNKLNKLSRVEVEKQHSRLKGNISTTKKTLNPVRSTLRKRVVIGARNGKMYSQPVR